MVVVIYRLAKRLGAACRAEAVQKQQEDALAEEQLEPSVVSAPQPAVQVRNGQQPPPSHPADRQDTVKRATVLVHMARNPRSRLHKGPCLTGCRVACDIACTAHALAGAGAIRPRSITHVLTL